MSGNSWAGTKCKQRFPVSLLREPSLLPWRLWDATARPLPGYPQLLLPHFRPLPLWTTHSPFWQQSVASSLSQPLLPFALLLSYHSFWFCSRLCWDPGLLETSRNPAVLYSEGQEFLALIFSCCVYPFLLLHKHLCFDLSQITAGTAQSSNSSE